MILAIIFSFIAGAIAGVFIMALCAAAGREDDRRERDERKNS